MLSVDEPFSEPPDREAPPDERERDEDRRVGDVGGVTGAERDAGRGRREAEAALAAAE
jgi:hypothetical protein